MSKKFIYIKATTESIVDKKNDVTKGKTKRKQSTEKTNTETKSEEEIESKLAISFQCVLFLFYDIKVRLILVRFGSV